MAEPDAKWLLREALDAMPDEAGGVDMDATLPALSQFIAEFAAPGFVCVMQGLPPTPPTTHPGVEGLSEGWADYAETFASVRANFREVHESDEALVVLVDQVATTRHGAVEISQPSAMVFAFEAGRVARIEFHLDHDTALRSAGLEAD